MSFKPQGETKGLKGTVPRTGLPRGQTQFSRRVLSERATGCVGDDPGTVSGPRGSTARLLTEHECVKGAPTQEPAIAHGADGASTPRRATIPRTGGRRPQDRQATLRFLIRPVTTRSCGLSFLCLWLTTSSCVWLCGALRSLFSFSGVSSSVLRLPCSCLRGLVTLPPLHPDVGKSMSSSSARYGLPRLCRRRQQ